MSLFEAGTLGRDLSSRVSGWVGLLDGHPERIRCELGVHRHVFLELIPGTSKRLGL